MKPHSLLALVVLLAAGCASVNVNPPQARAHTGYVDFHADAGADLMWDVARFDDRTGGFQRVFSKPEPLHDPVLRLAFAPGHHRLRVTFLNRPIAQPVEVEVEIQDGKITPILCKLTEAGTALVDTKSVSRGATAYGRYGRSTRISTSDTAMYEISAVAGPPVAYQPKEGVSYGP